VEFFGYPAKTGNEKLLAGFSQDFAVVLATGKWRS